MNRENPLPREVYLQRSRPRTHPIRGEFFRDQTAIVHSMPFRRLKHKTQVIFAPDNDHVCTRIEHVIHVATIAAAICKGLNQRGFALDLDLAYAIGLGHDLGHAPFGHAGEEELSRLLGPDGPFIHEINSYRVAEHLANDGQGLNLTFAVLDGIISHNGEVIDLALRPDPVQKKLDEIADRAVVPSTFEGCTVRLSDKIAYLGRDIEDAMRAGLIDAADVPERIRNALGSTNGEIINTLLLDLIEASAQADRLCFSDEKRALIKELLAFNHAHIYRHERLLRYGAYGRRIIADVFDHLRGLIDRHGRDFEAYARLPLKLEQSFGDYFERMDAFYARTLAKESWIVTDYVAGMSDGFILDAAQQIHIPAPIV